MHFYRKLAGTPRRLGILAGSFNPPTMAHLELIRAAGARVDEMICVLPRRLPHKRYFGATLEQRIEMLEAAAGPDAYSIAAVEHGLFIDIARECRAHYGPATGLYFLCGRDAAERIFNWDYGHPGAIEKMLGEFELLVAPRQGDFAPPAEWSHRIHYLETGAEYDLVSSTEVRERIRAGEEWERLAPAAIREQIRRIYS